VLELALKYGGSILQEPVSRMGQWHAAIRDPDGNSLEVYSLAADR
jgi:predicted lactoylglutathione lyase